MDFLTAFLNRSQEQIAIDNKAIQDRIAHKKQSYAKLLSMNAIGNSLASIRQFEKESEHTFEAAYLDNKYNR